MMCLRIVLVAMAMAMSMTMVIMIPRVSPAQENRTVLLRSVQNPKPHDGAHDLTSPDLPALRGVKGEAAMAGIVAVGAMSV